MRHNTSNQSKSISPRSAEPEITTLPVPVADVRDVKIVNASLETNVVHPSREQLIAEAAFHRAESRSFEPGHEIDDWIAAEAEVDARLQGEGRAY